MPGRTHTHRHTRAHLYKIPSSFFSHLNSLFVISAVCLATRMLWMSGAYVSVRACVWLLSVGVDFHSIVTIRRLEFNLNEMWQMGKNVEFERARENPMSECGGSAAQIDTHFFISFARSISLQLHWGMLPSFLLSLLSLSFFRWLLADIPRWSASLHTIYALTCQANKLFVLLFVVRFFGNCWIEYIHGKRGTDRRFMCVVWVKAKSCAGARVEARNKKRDNTFFMQSSAYNNMARAYIKKIIIITYTCMRCIHKAGANQFFHFCMLIKRANIFISSLFAMQSANLVVCF